MKEGGKAPKAQRGIALGLDLIITDLEKNTAKIDIEAHKKIQAGKSLGVGIGDALNIWEVDKNYKDLEATLYRARLFVINESHYKQMVKLVDTVLKDSAIGDTEANQVIELLIGLIDSK
jgi:hypothetical protein